MPTLADIYSAINTAKRKGADFVQNPGTSLQQMLGNANDKARGFNQLNDQALAELEQTGQLSGPAGQQLMGAVGSALNPAGMTVYHGSPHVFQKFDMSKIGTGEGAQSYGEGMYMAQNPDIARIFSADRSYVGAAMKNKPSNINYDDPAWIAQKTIDEFGNPAKAMSHLQMVQRTAGKYQSPETKAAVQGALDLITDNKVLPKGSLYKVDLPDTHIRRMLDWDAPLKEQPSNVRALAKQLNMDMSNLGSDLLDKVGKDEAGRKVLQDAGIRGVKYFDQNSAAKQKGTRNFVVFDPEHLTVLERNAKPIK